MGTLLNVQPISAFLNTWACPCIVFVSVRVVSIYSCGDPVDLVLRLCYSCAVPICVPRDVISGVQRVSMHPRGLGSSPSTSSSYPPMQSRRIELSRYTYEVSCSQLSYFEVSEVPSQDPILKRGPLERAGAADQEPVRPLWKPRDP